MICWGRRLRRLDGGGGGRREFVYGGGVWRKGVDWGEGGQVCFQGSMNWDGRCELGFWELGLMIKLAR